MIIKRYLLVLVSFCLISSTCRKTENILRDLVVPTWQSGEKLIYGIYQNDILIGQANYSLFLDTDGDIPIFSLEIVTQSEFEEGFLWDSSIVHFRRDNFSPIWSLRHVETDFGYSIVETHYDGRDIEIWLETIDGKESYDFSMPEPYFDNEMLYTLLRAIRFTKVKKYSLNTLYPLTLQRLPISIKYNGRVTITTPVGIFDCDRIYLTSIQTKTNLYYERTEPRRLIKYQEKNSPISFILIKG
jgi:hypothetical protein